MSYKARRLAEAPVDVFRWEQVGARAPGAASPTGWPRRSSAVALECVPNTSMSATMPTAV